MMSSAYKASQAPLSLSKWAACSSNVACDRVQAVGLNLGGGGGQAWAQYESKMAPLPAAKLQKLAFNPLRYKARECVVAFCISI